MMTESENQAVPMVTANASTSRTPALARAEKPKNFSGIDFKRWQQKMFFYLTTLCLQKFIKEDVPDLPYKTPENERFVVIETWKLSDFSCKNYILSGLDDNLYNVYSGVETSKELWNALENKYKTEDAGMKKFIAAKYLDYKMVDSNGLDDNMYNVYSGVEMSKELWNALEKKYKTKDAGMKKFVAAKFLDYKMVDSKSVITQVQELQVIIHDLLAEVREAFATYTPAGPGETVHMGNASIAKVEGYRKIFLKMTSGKVMTLNNVLHVPEMRKNLVSTGLLVKHGFKCFCVRQACHN
ncbi:uncharacterized protein [Nicotiana tomentosiformis]|uniref:uncharacterized protein n=1 Tax=Nicotiana tomentosiformis TaxID=4098 RepID=UPI00388C5B1F